MTIHPRFLESELPRTEPDACLFHVVPVPYEASVSYGRGTSKGPAAILTASCQLEVWTGRSIPSRRGIYTWPAVNMDAEPEEALACIEAAVLTVLTKGPQGSLPQVRAKHAFLSAPRMSGCLCAPVVPVILGGEHTITLGVLRALKKKYGHFGIVQFDAHADLRDSYEGSPYSHACVMRRAMDDLGLSLLQIGVRSLSPEERAFRQKRHIPHLDARVARFPLPQQAGGLESAPLFLTENGRLLPRNSAFRKGSLLPPSFPDKLFLTFDIDAFDASLMPATGTPEPGGLFWWDALHLVERSLAGRICLGFDVVELAPIPGNHAPDYTAARLVHEIMGLMA